MNYPLLNLKTIHLKAEVKYYTFFGFRDKALVSNHVSVSYYWQHTMIKDFHQDEHITIRWEDST